MQEKFRLRNKKFKKNPRRWGGDKKGRRGAGPEKCLKTLARKLSVAFHSVMRLASLVEPPLLHAVTWSASISLIL